MKRGCWLLFLFSPSLFAITLDQLQQRFHDQTLVRAHFEQTRTIKSLPQPLRSQGEMLIARDQGVLWDQTSPFPMTLMLDDSRMVQVVNGQSPQVITADNNPQLFQFNHLLRGLFEADRQVLEQNFQLDFQDTGNDRWRLNLTPVTSPLDKIFSRIGLTGDTYLNTIVLLDKQGDRTEIALSNQRLTPATLTDAERQRFTPR